MNPRVAMELHVQTIQQSNALEEDKQKQIYAERKKYEETVNLLRNPANDPAKLAEDLYVRLARGEEAAFVALQRLNDQMGGAFDAMLVAFRNKNPELKKRINAQFDAAMKELEATEKELADAEKKRIREWWADFDANLDALSKENKAAAKGKKKTADQEFDEQADELESQIKETEGRQKAEAGRIVGQVGKDAAKQRIAEAQAENPNADPEQIAVKVAAALASAFRQNGASQGGALIAAQRLVGNAGFQVSRQQVFGAARQAAPRQQPARRRAAKAKPKPKPVKQASVLPAVQGTQTAVAATQAAVAAGQAKVAKLESNVQQLIRDAVRLRNRATEQAPTALNSGSSVA